MTDRVEKRNAITGTDQINQPTTDSKYIKSYVIQFPIWKAALQREIMRTLFGSWPRNPDMFDDWNVLSVRMHKHPRLLYKDVRLILYRTKLFFNPNWTYNMVRKLFMTTVSRAKRSGISQRLEILNLVSIRSEHYNFNCSRDSHFNIMLTYIPMRNNKDIYFDSKGK